MKTKLEIATLTYDYLMLLSEGYETGDFSPVFPHLAKDCVMESQWVLTPNEGYDAVVSYLNGKGDALKKTSSFPSCSIEELVGNINTVKNIGMHVNGEKQQGTVGLWYPTGELCLLMEQKTGDKTTGVILRIKLNDDEKIARIDLCMPELFRHRCFYTFIQLLPCKDASEKEDAMIRVSEDYYCELYLFLGMVDIDFDQYDDVNIPIEKWTKCLEYWKRFYSFKTFDEAYEDACGIDYKNFTALNESAMRNLNHNGNIIWENRVNGVHMVDGLIEWTEKYKKACNRIKTLGF